MNRIDATFSQLKKKKEKAFIAFLTAGDPNLTTTEKLVLGLEKAGADIVELGVPFSDPIADGPTIQASSKRALDKGVALKKILAMVVRLRKRTQLPLCLMMYYNQVFHFGEKKFVETCAKSGVDGLIIPDLPPEEAKPLIRYAKQKNIATVFFIAPTTQAARIKTIAKTATGFIYYISLTGVTGARCQLPAALQKQIRLVKKYTAKPVCVGFGISNPAQVRSVARMADGVIVGSAIVNEIQRTRGNVTKVSRFIQKLSSAL